MLRVLVVSSTLAMFFVMWDFLTTHDPIENPLFQICLYYAFFGTVASPMFVTCMYYLNRKLTVWLFLLFPAINALLIVGLIGGLRALA